VRLFLSRFAEDLDGTQGKADHAASESSEELSATAFESRARAILLQYMPAADRRRLRPSFRDFISRNESRSGRVRHRLIRSLERFDLSDLRGIQPQFNRDHGDAQIDRRLAEIEKQALDEETNE
jgi:hypothetical protein